MSGHVWKLKRVQVMREGELQASVCEGCGGYRLALLPAGGGGLQVFATDPDPLPENCSLALNPPKQAVLGIFGADRKVSTAQDAF